MFAIASGWRSCSRERRFGRGRAAHALEQARDHARAQLLRARIGALAVGLGAALLAVAAVVAAADELPGGGRLVRVAPAGAEPNGASGEPALSADGSVIAFASDASNFGPEDTNGLRDVYVFDLRSRRAELVSTAADGSQANGVSATPSISADGTVVAFVTAADNLVPLPPTQKTLVIVRKRGGPPELASRARGGAAPDGDSFQPHLSADGRFVAFASAASNLVPGDTNRKTDVFVYDRLSGALERVSVSRSGRQANGNSANPRISADGRYVCFSSAASNLVPGDRNRVQDVFVRDRLRRRTERVSVSSSGREQNAALAPPFAQVCDISADGRYVVFDSDASNLARGDINGRTDVFLRDRKRRRTELVSRTVEDGLGLSDSFNPALSGDGRTVVFQSFAENLAPPFGSREHVYVRGIGSGGTATLDEPTAGRFEEFWRTPLLVQPAISSDGRVAAFESRQGVIVPDDRNGVADVFVRSVVPPETRLATPLPKLVRGSVARIAADSPDPTADRALCRLDRRPPFRCPLGRTITLRRLRKGLHRFAIAAGAPGTLYDRSPLVWRFRVP